MFFKRSNGEFRETDRVTRFKLIKSGKNWLRAATSNFGLLKVIRGQVEETVVAEVREDEVSATEMTSRGLLKGIVAAGAVLGAATVANAAKADENGSDVATASELSSEALVLYLVQLQLLNQLLNLQQNQQVHLHQQALQHL